MSKSCWRLPDFSEDDTHRFVLECLRGVDDIEDDVEQEPHQADPAHTSAGTALHEGADQVEPDSGRCPALALQ